MKKNAWTMAELTIGIIVMMILTAASMTITKNMNINKGRIFVYAAMKNISTGNIAISEANDDTFYPTEAETHDNTSGKADWYCLQLANSLSTEGEPTCTDASPGSTTVNFVLANGTSVIGASTSWQHADGDLYYKNIMVDIDGNAGSNKIGIDRFPLRVFRGILGGGQSVDGLVYPVNCSGDQITKADGSGTVTLVNNYCSGKSNNLASTSDFISYNIYRVTDGSKPDKASMIASGLSAIDADCQAYGPVGFYGGKKCQSAAIKLREQCAHELTCDSCATFGICPGGGTKDNCITKANSNMLSVTDPDTGVASMEGFECFVLLNKPTGGLGMIGSAVMNEMGM